MAPVRLHPPSLRRPVVGVPHGAVDPHGLVLREGNTAGLLVTENPDRNAVYKEPVDVPSWVLMEERESFISVKEMTLSSG